MAELCAVSETRLSEALTLTIIPTCMAKLASLFFKEPSAACVIFHPIT